MNETLLCSPLEMCVTFLTHFSASIYPGKSYFSVVHAVSSAPQALHLHKIHT